MVTGVNCITRKLFMQDYKTLQDFTEDVKNTLAYFSRIGCRGFDPLDQTKKILSGWEQAKQKKPVSRERLTDIQKELGDCRRCGLSKTRNHIVFGEGNPRAKLVFVGEGPGAEENRMGKPFVGEAGHLLTRIINAMHLTRDDVYIGNIVKCRPPGNRNPQPDEVRTCMPFLMRQISSIKPEVICTLGKVATQSLLGIESPISRLRGKFHTYEGIKVMPTFHPAYLLRNPKMKRAVWEDMQKVMKLLNL